ncbi:MAG: TonB-dependent receptor [Bacteroidaceae bacterium]|nr:TonB-dependent receptor [Bacteroidaceae bacterium]
MNTYRLLSLSFLLMLCGHALSQSFTLQGKVTDEDGNPLELATVMIGKQNKLTMTNLKGEYTLEAASADTVEVRFSMVGYRAKVRKLVRPRGKQTLIIQLFSHNELEGITVTQTRRQTSQTEDIDAKVTKQMVSASGNAVEDVIKMQAGVSSRDELSSQYNVRGGSFDENSVYINDVEVYRPFLVRSGQQEGLSVINSDMVEKINFSTGGFEAQYGDKMSSALAITYKRPTRFEASLSASLLGASAYVGLATKKIAWTHGLRYKTNRYLLSTLETKGEYNPNFLDYQTYFSYRPNKRWSIDVIGNISDNHYNFKPEDRETRFGTLENVKAFRVYFDGHEKDLFRTYFGSLSITRHFTDNTSLSLIGSAFSTDEQERYDIQGQYWLTQTETSENLGVGSYMEHARNYLKADVQSAQLVMRHRTKKHELRLGVALRNERIRENSREYEMRDSAGYTMPHTGTDLNMIYTLAARNRLKATRIESYVQDTYRFATDSNRTFFTLNYGVRLARWSFNKETIVSPRASLAIVPAFNNDITFRFATGLYYQAPFYKELRDTTTINGITYATLNEKIKSQRSIHFIAAFDYRFKVRNQKFRFTAEAYYKALSNLVPYSVSNVKVVYYGTNEGSGHSAGLDLKLYGEFVPGTDSWLAISLMDTKMKLNNKTIAMPTDQRYAVNLFFTDYFPGTDRWKMSLKLTYADGLPFSAPHRELETNAFRSPAYKRVDVGMSYRLLNNEKREKNKWLRNIWLGVDGLNLFGINNVNSYYWITDVTNQQYAVPNYLTGRQINARLLVEF